MLENRENDHFRCFREIFRRMALRPTWSRSMQYNFMEFPRISSNFIEFYRFKMWQRPFFCRHIFPLKSIRSRHLMRPLPPHLLSQVTCFSCIFYIFISVYFCMCVCQCVSVCVYRFNTPCRVSPFIGEAR